MVDEQVPQEDIIDDQVVDMLYDVIGEDAPEEELDAAADIYFSVLEELVEDGMPEIPDNDATDEQKKDWIENHFPKTKEAFLAAIGDAEEEEHRDDSDT